MIRIDNARGRRLPARQLLIVGLISLLALHPAFAQPNANFTADVTQGCSPFTVRFTDLSSGTIHTWFWDFGNGNTSVFDDVIATYTNPGTYTVSLTVTDTVAGLASTRTEVAYITVYADPVADFAPDTTSGCAPLTVQFTDLSSAGSAPLTSWSYDFGDGTLGTTANPSHTYTAAGYYTVTQVVTDGHGCSDVRVYHDLIHVTEVATVDFTAAPQTGCSAPLQVRFTSSVSPAGSYSYLWDFGDGGTSSAPNPIHLYTTTGDFTITLTVTDPNGCQETVQKDNFVLINTPAADFQALSTTVCTGQPVQFENLSTGADGYLWTFGDGGTSTGVNPTHTYAAPGTYPVSLTATNSAGCSDFEGKSGYITVYTAPAVSFTVDDNRGCDLPFQATFTDQSIGNIVTWYWEFGNGNFANGQNPTTTYNAPGTYDVSLTVTTANGCQGTATIPDYIVVAPPVANFLLGPDEGCLPLTVNFLNLSTSPADPIVGYAWTFGDGNVSSQASPTHTYAAPGQYTVSLTVTTQSGCQDTEVYQFVEVGTKPNVNFQGTPRVACVGEGINFTDLTLGGGTEWYWNFGDGTGSNVQHPVHAYQDTGYFPVSLIVSYLGCEDTLQRDSFIHIVGPLADFTLNPAQGCNPPLTVSFFDQSGGANTWHWDFGDGGTSTLQNPTHVYATTGNFTITLVVTDSVSGCVNQAVDNLAVTDPRAGFMARNNYGCAPLAVEFTNQSLDATGYLWDFGDGATSTAANPNHTYTTPGVYSVTLIATDGACADTLVRNGLVRVIGGTADFTVDVNDGCAPLPVRFTDASTPFLGTSIVSWSWQFGDGGVAFSPNPTYTYSNPGSYDVTLTILDSEGCVARITKQHFINPTFPAANFITTDTVACPGAFISFTNLSVGHGLSYLWQFGDGTTATAPNPTHLYPGNGTYTVSLTVTDANGCVDTYVRPNYIVIGQPTANFTANNTTATCPPLTVEFIDQSSPNTVSWYWDFGDGSTSTLPNPSKIYTTAGDYDVTLVVTTAQGCSDTLTRDNFIRINGPVGTFSFTPTAGCQPLLVNFTAHSPHPAWDYSWDFGDGTGGTGTTATHTYLTDTTANPVLIIEDQHGCVVYITNPDPITIHPLPRPAFSVNNAQICLGETVRFTNTSTSQRPIVGFLWDFGDGNTSTIPNPQHTYLDTGTYYVNLQLTTLDGCVDTAASPVMIRVTAPPTAAFIVSPDEACVPFPATFTESATGAFPIVNWQWNFGDGNGATGQIIAPHTYTTAGVYAATLTVTDNRGCTGAITRNVRVNPLPTVDFDAFRYGCAPISIAFSDLSSGSAPAQAWLWNFGDGLTATTQNPTHVYANNGNYGVSLRVTDANGCVNTRTKPGFIRLRHPVANFTSNAGITCPPQTVTFTNTSTHDTTLTYQWDFGDGHTSTQASPVHVYHSSDTFTVTLIVTDVFGCSDTLVRPDHVITYEPPTASFTVSDDEACVPENIIFTSTSTPSAVAITSYLWNFGSGSGVTTPVASHLYVNAGTYTATLIIRDANGCRDTATRTIQIHPNPVANFQAGDTVGCAIATINFQDLSGGVNAPVAWDWDFGDGHFATNQNPANTYFADGTYSVKLVVTDINGCQDSLTRPNYIDLDHPNAAFSLDQVQACPGTVVSFTDQSTGNFPMVHWVWNFGDLTPLSNQQNPAHTYNTPGLYNVSLIVTDAINCRDTVTQPALVQVHTGPTAAFTYSPSQGCEPLTVAFTDASVSGSIGIATRHWDFGDGGSSVVNNPTYVYSSPGLYTVTLTVTDANGCEDVVTRTVRVLEVPTVDFVADKRRGCAPEAIRFTDLSTSPYVKTAWRWDFGDGNSSTSPGPVHTYLADGVYTVKLVVTDQNGCRDSMTKVNYIRLSHPVANFTYDQGTVCPNVPVGVSFTDQSAGDTLLLSWNWQFGDGNTATAQHPSHSYATPGTYSVILRVADVLGCSAADTQVAIISVLNPPATAFAMDDSANCTPLTINFTDQTAPGDGAVVAWRWTFGNGDTSLIQHPSYTWHTPGLYTVTLTATDNNGCQYSDSTRVRAYQMPVARFMTADTFGCAPRTVTFTNQSTSAFPIVWRKWYFGDGDSAVMAVNPTHTYAADGVYTVTLIVEDANGCRDTLVRPNYVRLTHPVANFTYDLTEVCPGIPVGVSFTDLSIADHPLTSWQWNFGDGTVSTLQHPTHSYPVPGTYDVSLIVRNVYGCRDTVVIPSVITVLTPPTAAFSASDTADCAPFSLSLTDLSLAGDGALQSWTWHFGTGDTSLVQNPAYTYPVPGVYTLSLTVVDDNGCRDTHSLDVEAYGLPTAHFVASDTVGCAPATITFTDLSYGPAAITGWLWSFGDGGTSTQKNPTHTYTADGVYSVTLTVTDAHGCVHTRTRTQYIRLTHPVANFTYSPAAGCPGTVVAFTNGSTGFHALSSYLWDFGDGHTATQVNPTHAYHVPGLYTVSLTVTDVLGCSDTEVKGGIIRIYVPPVAATLPGDTAGCTPLVVDFQSGATPGTAPLASWSWNFGNGNTSTAANPLAQTYAPYGVYTVTHIVTDGNGCRDTVQTRVEAYQNPVANFVASDTVGCAPRSITFSDQSAGPVAITSWLWSFGDGGTSTQKSPTHIYVADGVYSVTLTVTDANGCSHTFTRPNYIRLTHPAANFTYSPAIGCPGLAVNFTDASTGPHALANWLWDFGDGTTSVLPQPTHIYQTPGYYTVSLTVTDVLGCSDTETKVNAIRIFVPPVVATVPGDTAGCAAPLTVDFNSVTTPGDAALASWNWTFGNGNSSTAANPGPQLYTTFGLYTVTLIVTDANNCRDTATVQVEAYEEPQAYFIASDTVGCSPVDITFTDLSTGPAAITAWYWDFGDGNSSTQKSPTHTYVGDGLYTVSLTVTDAHGCTHTLTRSQYIRLTHPAAAFTHGPVIDCPGLTVNFSDASASFHALASWQWNFGDGTSSTTPNPVHTYHTPGTYTVSLSVTDVLGCSDLEVKPALVRIHVPPVAAITPGDTAGCTPFVVDFQSLSTPGGAPLATWTWNFGNGQTSTAANPIAQTYTPHGLYPVTLVVSDGNGCRDTAQVQVDAYQAPTARFVASDTVGCSPVNITFTDQSTGPAAIVAWLWNFGDGGTSTLKSPTHSYSADGVYTVTLTVTDANGCSHTLTRPQYIRLTHPAANFLAGPTQGCPGLTVTFTDASSGPHALASWLWTFGDGSSSTLPDPAHTYHTPGVYTVTLTVTDALGCSDTETRTNLIRVHVPPVAATIPGDTAGCTPFVVDFRDGSTAGGSGLAAWNWNFGNGQTATGFNPPPQVYDPAGTYTVTLTVTDARGCQDTAYTTVQALPGPTSAFIANQTTGCAPQLIHFTDQSSGPYASAAWLWNFGDGATSTQANPSHTYTSNGVYTVSLIVWDVNGCSDTLVRTNYINLNPPTANFTLDDGAGCTGHSVQFTDLSTADTTVVGWLWNFGDGTTSTLQHPSHTYATAGTYTVTLTVTDALGCTDVRVRTNLVQVFPGPTVAFTVSDSSGCRPLDVFFSSQSVGNGGPLVMHQWNFGDGTTGLGASIFHSFPNAGIYTVTLTVTDANGCVSQTSRSIRVHDLPTADFFTNQVAGCAGTAVNFVNTSGGPQALTTWQWDFGDGTGSMQMSPSHVYTDPGAYMVSLIVTDIYGCSDTLMRPDYVEVFRPTAAFTLSDPDGCPGHSVQFTDASTDAMPITNWQWSFGDGSTSLLQNPSHTYPNPGSYDVRLIVTSALGCRDTVFMPGAVTVYPNPLAQFAPDALAGCQPFVVSFTDQSVAQAAGASIASWQWTFGDGSGATQQHPTHTYASAGIYPVVLRVTDDYGCTAQVAQSVQAYALPVANFAATTLVGCAPQAVQFADLSSGPYLITGWKWYFGDGDSASVANPIHTYTSDGVYSVTLIVTDIHGCSDTLTRPQYIRLRHPQANFTASVTDLCPGDLVQFTDLSVPDTTLMSWQWQFGDGGSSTQQHPTHIYTSSGQYQVRLIVTNILGCSDTLVRPQLIEVAQAPIAAFSSSDTVDCTPFAVSFTNLSQATSWPIAGYQWTFGNGASSNQVNPATLYTAPGAYVTQLVVTDQNGCTDTARLTLTATTLPAPAFIGLDSVGCAPQTVEFINQSTGPYPFASYFWQFGDGNSSTAQFPVHTYAYDGTYSVSLTVTDINGCSGTLLKPAYIRLAHPVADFTADQQFVCPGTVVTFTDASSGPQAIVDWQWDFGGLGTASGPDASFLFTQPGTYAISLTVTDALGCSHTVTQTDLIEVIDRPEAIFTPSVLAGCMPLSVTFANQSVPHATAITAWNWNFGGLGSSALANPAFTFHDPGVYPVSLIATDAFGCTDTATTAITVYELPVARFTASDSLGCAPTDITFFSQSIGPVAITSWSWTFGDGGTATSPVPVHHYAYDGTYTVGLVVTDLRGCRDTLVKPQYIELSHPLADFTADDQEVCPETTIRFTDLSVGDTTLMAWSWDFGDGTPGSSLQHPQHTYQNPGLYTVSLTVTNVEGCTHTVSRPAYIEVLTPPTAAFAPSEPEGCQPLPVAFTDLSQGNPSPVAYWHWDFGNGDTSVVRNPFTYYPVAGIYDVTLSIRDFAGCVADTTMAIEVYTRPTANFVASDTVGCAEHITFFDLSVSDYTVTSWWWNFGDGHTATDKNPVHTYENTGTYTVSLIVTDEHGCSDTLTKPQYIQLTRPVAAFAQDNDVVCPNAPLQFMDMSVPDFPITAWYWDFGDGATSTLQNPVHTYTSSDTFTVTLVITNVYGCTDTEVGKVEVLPPPRAIFAPSDIQGCTPFHVHFTDQSMSYSAPIFAWQWHFGNNQYSTLQNPNYTYQNPGTFPVSLTVIDGNGCFDDTTVVLSALRRPTAGFTATPRLGCAPQPVQFTSTTTGVYPIVAYFWDFGDGTGSNQANPAHTYVQDDLYTVRLITEDINGCRDTLVRPDYIRLRHPQANFTWSPAEGCPGMVVNFHDTSVPDTTISNWMWDFGDGHFSTQQHPAHAYHTPGIYTVTLTTTNVVGCSDTEIKANIVVVNTPPVAAFRPPDSAGCQPFAVSFFNQSSYTQSPIASYYWNFGGLGASTLPNPSFTFGPAGAHTVSLVITDIKGCKDTATRVMTAHPLPQPAFLANDSTGCAPKTVNFFDQTVGSSTLVAWQWTFGDGGTGSGQFPAHTYFSDGYYDVSLTVTDIIGCTNTLTKPQYIKLGRPVANFTLTPGVICPGEEVSFFDASQADTFLVAWQWNFGDPGSGANNISTEPNPTHLYTQPGTYTVSLTVTNLYGCSHTHTKVDTVHVLTPATAQFVPSTQAGCVPLTVSFQNNTVAGSAPVASWNWTFGNGQSSIFTHPNQHYNAPGSYDVRLIATDSYGCKDTTVETITVYVPPVAAFTSPNPDGCAPATVSFLDQSQAGDAIITGWNWFFGDGGTATSQFPNYIYPVDGSYEVTLAIVDANGCVDTVVRPDFVDLSHPIANFTQTANQLCPSTMVSFLDASLADTTLVAWHWNFGDGSTASVQNPTHMYAAGGTYTVTLTVTNVLGCSHTVSKPNTVHVLSGPQTVFTPSLNQGCTPFGVTFTDNSTGPDAPIVAWDWTFGDGSASSAQNPGHTYTVPGLYTVTLTTTDNNGCSSSFTRQVTSLTLPTANFMTVDTIGCAPLTADFFDLSTGQYQLASWRWSFGDGGTSVLQHPTHNYATDGIYDVALIATDINGCRDTLVKPAYVRLSNPVANFTLSPASGCPGLDVRFTSTSVADTTLVQWFWTFGDGTTSVMQHPSHVYQNPGQYTVSLTVTNAIGCTDQLTRLNVVQVAQPPLAGFLIADTLGCTPFTPDITDNTVAFSSPVVDWAWDFGNGDQSADQEPVYTYTQPGTYGITLVVTDGLGCADTAYQTVVAAASPTAAFTGFDTLGCAPQTVQFANASTSLYNITRYTWTFGDGQTSGLTSPAHTYLQDGVYSVQLVIEDESGCTDTLNRPHYVRLSHPVADMQADVESGCEGTTVNFTFTGTADTTLVGWLWTFGDGSSSSLQHPSKRYENWGEYDVSLIVTNILGCRDTLVRPQLVDIYQPPVAAIQASDTSGCVPFQVDFEDFSTSTYGLSQWEWFVNGAPKGGSQSFSQYFGVVGEYEIMLVVTDANGCSDTTTQMVYVRPIPVANFIASDTLGCAPAVLTFTDYSVHPPTEWYWDFGDGGYSDQQHPVHTYTEDGIYTVKLRIVDRYGCEDEVEKINYIRLDHPNINFTVSYTPGCPPIQAHFRATGGGLAGMAKWQWNFGDGIAATVLRDTVMHGYQSSGLFDVTLIGTDSLGCATTLTRPQLIEVLGDIIPDPIEIHAVSVLRDNQIEIRFAPHADEDFKHYTIYREEPGVGFVPVHSTTYVNDTIFIDGDVQANERSYCYKVTATNHCGTESDMALTETHCSVNLVATPIPGEIILTWNPYLGWDEVTQYEIYRVEGYNQANASFVGIVPGYVNRYTEPFEHCFNNVAYRIRAVGPRPVEVAWSDTAQALNRAGIRGNPTQVVRATVENNASVLVEWKPFDLPGQTTIYVERSINGGSYANLMSLPAGEEKFNDRDVDVSHYSYAYRVQAQDSCGNKTPLSNIGKSILLTAEQTNGITTLRWTPYEEWRFGVREYTIEIFNDTLNRWQVRDRVQGTRLEYEDRGTSLNQAEYCYRVWAVENGGNEALSLSNQVCVRSEASLFAPNAFTPNGDGINDIFFIDGYHVEQIHLQIFSRWGLLLFESYSVDQGWDGTYKGSAVNEGVYVYVVTGRKANGQSFHRKGTINLIR